MFHIPQSQRYCKGDFYSWDPKITTFPGLNLAGTAYVWLLFQAGRAFAGNSLVLFLTWLPKHNETAAAKCCKRS